jgi:hypothetical protein
MGKHAPAVIPFSCLPPKLPQDDDQHIGWVTITYRSVFLAITILIVLIGVGLYFAFPDQTKNKAHASMDWVLNLVGKVGGPTPAVRPQAGEQKANFTMIDGSVRVRKKNDNSFVTAGYNVPLEKGDVVQTGPEGMAKIVFADKTSYTVKPDSLIVIEENSTNEAQQTKVAVQVTTGTVDLATANYSSGSKCEVILAGATASLAPESSAQVRNESKKDNYEILMKTGTGAVKRGDETVQLNNFEKVTFKAEAKTMTKDKELQPPTLLDPGNMISVFTSGTATTVEFTWTPVTGAKGYKIRLAKNAYFTEMIGERAADIAQLRMPLSVGQYYWSVKSIDTRNKPSMESERFRFNVVPKSRDEILPLDVEEPHGHGRMVEIRGKTAPGARVIINGSEIPSVNLDGTFQYIIPSMMKPGDNMITVTAQNSKGETNNKTLKYTMQ